MSISPDAMIDLSDGYCQGCGENEPLEPYEYEGRILFLCEDCIEAVADE